MLIMDFDCTMKIRFFSLLFALCLSVSGLYAQGRAVAPVVPSAETLQRGFGLHDRAAFVAPDKVFYPETWFHFIGGNVSLEGITADLEAIAEAGIS